MPLPKLTPSLISDFLYAVPVDVAAYAAAHEAEWQRLDALVKRRRQLSGEEIDELVSLYQQTTTHLSAVRSAGTDPILVAAPLDQGVEPLPLGFVRGGVGSDIHRHSVEEV